MSNLDLTPIIVQVSVFLIAFIAGYIYGKYENKKKLQSEQRTTTVGAETDTCPVCSSSLMYDWDDAIFGCGSGTCDWTPEQV